MQKKFFKEILKSDLYDIQGGTTSEGIHTGTMGGAEEIVKRGFVGIDLLLEHLKVSPFLPQNWVKIELKILYQKIWLSFKLNKREIEIKTSKPLKIIEVKGKEYKGLRQKKIKTKF